MQKLEKIIGYHFKDTSLLILALTHKSYKKDFNNERLEFLGDAVLDLLVGEYLYCEFPDKNEGDLSKMRAALVNEQSFMRFAKAIHLDEFIIISANEESNKGREKSSILSSAFEALIGAIYLESGLERARELTYSILRKIYPKLDSEVLFLDYKTALQEETQALFNEIPQYHLIQEIGPDHCKQFEMALVINGIEVARCFGSSKKAAQQNCAKVAYQQIMQKKLDSKVTLEISSSCSIQQGKNDK